MYLFIISFGNKIIGKSNMATPLSIKTSNSGQFSYPLPNMVHPLDTITQTPDIFHFLLKDRYLKINNICGKNNNEGVEYRHDKKKYDDII